MLSVNICGVDFKNPVIGASGTFGFGREFEPYMDLNRIGGISTKGLTIYPKSGNMGRRIHETASGIMNSIGLQNPSVQAYIDNEHKNLKRYDTRIIANIGGATIEDYEAAVQLISTVDIDMIELNISCPNVKHGGMALGIKCDVAKEAVKRIRKVTKLPLIVKLSPNAEDISEMAYVCRDAGADALSLVNTFNALAIDIYKRKPIFNNITAGLSGPAIKPIALRMVRDVYNTVDCPVIGIGGISTWQDAIEFIMAGSSAVQVGAANFINPHVMIDIIEGIETFMKEQGINNLEEIKGVI